MAPPEEDPNFMFALAVLSTCQVIDPNYHDVARKIGVAHGRTAQQKFKKLVESTKKYALVNGKVVDLEEGGESTSHPTTPAKRGRGGKAASTPRSSAIASGGRKRKTKKEDESEEESDAEGTPSKKRATPAKRGAAKKAEEKVKAEADDEDEANENGGDNEGSGDGSGDGDGNTKEDAI